jgi:hypothetical protein
MCNCWHLCNSSWLSEITSPNRCTIIADCMQCQIPLNIHKKSNTSYYMTIWCYTEVLLSTDTQYSRSGTHALRLRNWLVTVGCLASTVAVVLLWESVLFLLQCVMELWEQQVQCGEDNLQYEVCTKENDMNANNITIKGHALFHCYQIQHTTFACIDHQNYGKLC